MTGIVSISSSLAIFEILFFVLQKIGKYWIIRNEELAQFRVLVLIGLGALCFISIVAFSYVLVAKNTDKELEVEWLKHRKDELENELTKD